MSDAEVTKFMEKEYPKFKGNMALGKLLYQKAMNKNPVVRTMGSPFEVQIKEIKMLPVKTKVGFRGLVAEIQLQTYQGCPECRKKVCNHGKGLTEITISKLLIGDDTDMVWTSGFSLNANITEGKEVEILGAVREWNNERDVSIYEIKLVTEDKPPVAVAPVKPVKGSQEDKVQRIVRFIEASRTAKLDMIKTMCESEGVSIKELENYVNVDVKGGMVYARTEYEGYP